MIISIICTGSELEKIKSLFDEDKLNINIMDNKNSLINFQRNQRVELIRDVLMLNSKLSTSELYNQCINHGYTLSYKTFQRDLDYSISIYNIKKEVKMGGAFGTTNYWELVS